MQVKEVKDLDMTALSRGEVKVGCQKFTLQQVYDLKARVAGQAGQLYFGHIDGPFFYTTEDCLRAMHVMDNFVAPKPPEERKSICREEDLTLVPPTVGVEERLQVLELKMTTLCEGHAFNTGGSLYHPLPGKEHI